jgi:hypothetical protein
VVSPARRQRSGVLSFFKIGGALFALIGFAMLAYGLSSDDAIGSMGLTITGGTFALIGVIWVLVALGVGGWYSSVAARQAQEQQLFQTGERVTAVIEGVEGTGVTINNCPQVYLTLRVKPRHGAEFVHQEKVVVPFGAVLAPGHLIDVAYDPLNPGEVALETDPRYAATPPAQYLKTRPPRTDEVAAAAPVARADDSPPTLIDQLERLGKLRDSGVLTEAEFQAQKQELLGG